MSQHQLPFEITPMILADIPDVVAIEQVAYTMPYPQRDYVRELEHNRLARYFVLRSLLPQFQINSNALAIDSPAAVIGVAGFWLMGGELHLMTIAVHPHWRGLGLGEWLLLALIEEGQTMGIETATLEVRPSNHVAISLYQKYQFQEVGRRPGYYSNDGEDALILTVPSLLLPGYQAMLAQRKAKLLGRLAQIKVDNTNQIT